MSTCIPTHALLSALVLRIRKDGVLPPESDFAALIALGITKAELLAALAPAQGPLGDDARSIVARLLP